MDEDLEPVSFGNVTSFEQCNYRQDSLLNIIYEDLTKEALSVSNLDKDLAFKVVEFTDIDEQFAKVFVENLTKNVTEFYVETKTSQSKKNIQCSKRRLIALKGSYLKIWFLLQFQEIDPFFSINTQKFSKYH
jgi:hypothetical protein